MLAPDRWVAVGLGIANVALAGLLFLEPVLFGRVVDVLSHAIGMSREQVWERALALLSLWGAVGLSGIGATVAVSLLADRMAHRNRLTSMHRYFEHVLALPLSFHGDVQSGRLMKVMLVGSDNLFSIWLSFFRDHLSTFVAAIVLLPLTLAMNWRLGLLLIALVVVFAIITAFVIRKTEFAQGRVEMFQSRLAGTAQDALSNVIVVQSFTRLASEARMFGDIVRQVLDHQFPVLNWWAVVSVLTRAASTLTVIAIFVLGTVLHLDGKATVGEIVSFMGFATLLIGKLEGAVAFVSRPGVPGGRRSPNSSRCWMPAPACRNGPARGRSAGRRARSPSRMSASPIPAARASCPMCQLHAPPGRTLALVGQTGAGKSTAMALLQRLWDPDRRAGHARRPRPARHHPRQPAAEHRRGVPGEHAVQPHHPGQPADRPAGGDPGRDRAGLPAWPRRMTSSPASRRATTPWSANAAPAFRAASGSGWRSPARC